MEKTTGKYSANTYEYYKNMIEIEVGWLQFLASFGRIKNTTSLDLEYQLELVKKFMYEGLDDFLEKNECNKSLESLSLIQKYLEDTLRKRNLEQAIPYIDYGMNTTEISDFIVLVYIRKYIKSISSNLRSIKETLGNNSDETRTLNTLIDQVTTTYPSFYLTNANFSDSLMEFFLANVGINYSNEGSGNAYIYVTLMILDRINAYICYMLPSEYDNEVKQVSNHIKKFDSEAYLESGVDYTIDDLTKAFDGINNNIELLKRALVEQKSTDVKKKKLDC